MMCVLKFTMFNSCDTTDNTSVANQATKKRLIEGRNNNEYNT